MPEVVVVGSGIGGLTAAALLARRGMDVLVLERHTLAGGFCTSWSRPSPPPHAGRFVFGAGVQDVIGLGPNGPLRRLLQELGVEDRIQWRRVTHEYVLRDYRLRIPPTLPAVVEHFASEFPHETRGIRSLFAELETVYRGARAALEESEPADALGTGGNDGWWALSHWTKRPYQELLSQHVGDLRARTLLSMLTSYLAEDPDQVSVVLAASLLEYYDEGGFFPAGGPQRLADALVSALESSGGRVRLRAPVRAVRMASGRAVGVELDSGESLDATHVICSGDLRRTLLELVGPAHLPARWAARAQALRPSTSAFLVHLGLDRVPDLGPVTIVRSQGTSFGIASCSTLDDSLAPPGCASVTLTELVPQPQAARWSADHARYAQQKERQGTRLIELAEELIPGLRAHVLLREDASPATMTRYAGTTDGAIYGPALGGWQPSARTPIPGLFLAGSGCFPGAGIASVVHSGRRAADAVRLSSRCR